MKKSILLISFIFLVANSSLVQAQTADSDARRSNAQIIDSILTPLQQRILDVAEAMPAEKYSFVPTCGEFKGVRNFAEQLKHIAADLYLDGAAILGENPPGDVEPGETGSRAVRSKLEIIAYVKASFEYMHRAADAIDDVNASVSKPRFLPYGKNSTTRLHIAIEDIGHTNDHYGQLVEYLRMNGIIPPASRKQDTLKPDTPLAGGRRVEINQREEEKMTLLLGLRTAQYHIKTSELVQARQWYAKALGLEPYFDQPYYVGFNVAGFELGLVPDDRLSPSREGAVAVYWGVTNIQSGLDHMLAIGATKTTGIQDVGGGVKKITVLDPFGNPFGLIENPAFGK